MKEEIKAQAAALGFDTFGVCPADPPEGHVQLESWLKSGYNATMTYMSRHADLRADPKKILPGAQSVIAVTLNYYQDVETLSGKPRIARYALGRDYHKVMRGKLRALARVIQSLAPNAECRACVDSAPILEREFAHLAGLGWFGKNTMLIDSKRGSWFFVGLLLTTLKIEPDQPAIGGCGTCKACVHACPTSAIINNEDRWQVDARKCISYLTIEHKGNFSNEQKKQIGEWTFGCDICQEVCPFNAQRPHQQLRAQKTKSLDFLAPRDWPDLKHLAQISHDEWDSLTQGLATRRAGYEGIKRNAQVNLENA